MVIFAVIHYFAQLLAVVIFVSVSLMRENLRGLRENLRHKIQTLVVGNDNNQTGNNCCSLFYSKVLTVVYHRPIVQKCIVVK